MRTTVFFIFKFKTTGLIIIVMQFVERKKSMNGFYLAQPAVKPAVKPVSGWKELLRCITPSRMPARWCIYPLTCA